MTKFLSKHLTFHLLKRLSALPLTLVFSLALNVNVNAAEQLIQQEFKIPGSYKTINLHDFTEEKRDTYTGKIAIVLPQKVSFSGILKALPKKKSTSYLYTALTVMEVSPLPTIEYQMFIGDPNYKDTVVPVYVDNVLADAIQQKLPTETHATWFGYHIYTYSRGPAIVIDNVVIDKPKS